MVYPGILSRRFQKSVVAFGLGGLVLMPALTSGQSSANLLSTRSELTAAAEQAELAASGNGSAKTRNALLAASIRQRLREGDFQPGDRLVLTVVSDAAHTDTLVVRSGGVIQLPGKISLSLAGVLRSELEGRVSAEILRYVKAQQITVTPLTRLGVLGEVARPGYFAFPSDAPITDAIMAAGGPTGTADVERTIVRRGSQEYRSADETRLAVSRGLTIDQFGLRAGDELIVGKQRQFIGGALMGMVGALASLTAVFVALRH